MASFFEMVALLQQEELLATKPPFQRQEMLTAWEEAHPIPGEHPGLYRTDDYGHRIAFLDYGRRDARHGWEIDHVPPKAVQEALRQLNPSGFGHILEPSRSYVRALHASVNARQGGFLASLVN